MDTIEISAKTIEEAIELALKELDANREEVAVEVLSQGRTGFLGIGVEEPRVRVKRLSESSGVAYGAIEIVNRLLSSMKVSALATIRLTDESENNPIIDIEGEDAGLLIGKRGESLTAFQYIVNLMLNSTQPNHPLVIIDIEKYRERRERSLESMARKVADQVIRHGSPVTLEPMPASERRIIHVTLADNPSIRTESTGERQQRKITIMPRDSKST